MAAAARRPVVPPGARRRSRRPPRRRVLRRWSVAVVHLTRLFGAVHIAGCEQCGAAHDPDRKTAAAIFP